MKKSFLIFFIPGTIFVFIFGIYKTVQGDTLQESILNQTITSFFENSLRFENSSRIISDSLAYEFFRGYHDSDNYDESRGILKNQDQPIIYFYLDEEEVIEPLRKKAKSLGKRFVGVTAIPAFNSIQNSHTLIWVAVVKEGRGRNATPKLMLPEKDEKWESFIYDFTLTCPQNCFPNSDQLWEVEWGAN